MRKTRKFYNHITPGYLGEQEARDTALHLDWSMVETKEETLEHVDYFDTVGHIEIYYCYGTDDYLYCESE